MRYLVAAVIGAIFGLGIVISGMADPAKVLNFFDLFGTFDPSLAFVLAGALCVAVPGYFLIFRARNKPVFDHEFRLPGTRKIDAKLVAGSAVFGIGWGIAGFCPGAAIPTLGLGHMSTVIFVVALLAGISVARLLQNFKLPSSSARPLPHKP
ncbi:UNVERIFIED_ORG: hypothetical protein BCL66_113103 [Martelella mediterranea]